MQFDFIPSTQQCAWVVINYDMDLRYKFDFQNMVDSKCWSLVIAYSLEQHLQL